MAIDERTDLVAASRWSRLRLPLGVGAGIAVACALVVAVDPNTPGHYPPCPTKVISGLDCPFCGGMRCARSLLTGDVAGAFDHNALVVVLTPIAVVAWIMWVWSRWTGRPFPGPRPSATVRHVLMWCAVAVILAWTVWRNLPAGAYFGSGLS